MALAIASVCITVLLLAKIWQEYAEEKLRHETERRIYGVEKDEITKH